DVLDKSVLYMRVFFLGMPVMLLYNFGSAILRAVGDTKRPLFYLAISGVLNVILNLIFVLIFDMDVAGVALATVLSQGLSAFLIVRCLIKTDGYCKLNLRNLSIKQDKLLKMIRIGLPAGLQGSIFSISNVLIQSSINSFGSIAMAGNTASSNLEGFVYNAMNAIYQTALTFTSQNYGGKQYARIKKVVCLNVIIVTLVGCVMGGFVILFGKPLLALYTSEAAAINYGLIRMKIIFSTYFLCGIMDVLVGCLRGLGRSILPMIVSLLGACGLRVLWIFTIFKAYPALETIYISYPISWTLTATVHLICLLIVMKSLSKKLKETNTI
ncbi:MAG: polysaccharide biosynthesis C-terminal domain-containing protein, partial [Lachnospiraceae bacterium]|nr:polysaccharide biosynthesis C-terminal domain-containing protein [Lachnospiraceae bacterium]